MKAGDVVIQNGQETAITKNVTDVQAGLTRRDFFAAAALPVMIERLASVGKTMPKEVAAASYQIADAMIAEAEGEI